MGEVEHLHLDGHSATEQDSDFCCYRSHGNLFLWINILRDQFSRSD